MLTEHIHDHGMYLPLYASQFIYYRFKSCFCVLGSFLQSGFFCLPICQLLVETFLQFLHGGKKRWSAPPWPWWILFVGFQDLLEDQQFARFVDLFHSATVREHVNIFSKSQAYNQLYTWHLGANADCFFSTNCLKSQGSIQVLILALGG